MQTKCKTQENKGFYFIRVNFKNILCDVTFFCQLPSYTAEGYKAGTSGDINCTIRCGG